jgi:ketosteroid isomerase-like protein
MEDSMAPRKTLTDAFGGKQTTLEEQRAIWAEALHEDAIWEGPTFEKPICVVGREATGRFMELLLSVVPKFSTTLVAAYPTKDPDTIIIESHGGGPAVHGGSYTQRYFSLVTTKNGQAFRMREYCNPFQTYKAFGKEKWERAIDEIMTKYNKPWPQSQPKDPISLPPI